MAPHGIWPRQTGMTRAQWIVRRLAAGGAALALLLTIACGDSSGPGSGNEATTLSGTVRAAEPATALSGAIVTAGTLQVTSDADGRFELSGLATGPVTVQVRRPGYTQTQAGLTLTAGANSHDFTLTAQEVYQIGPTAVYVPTGAGPIRGAIVVLGGPLTSGLVTGEPISSPGLPPEHEQGLQSMGADLRALARSARVALIGTRTIAMENSPVSDDGIFAALANAATLAGRPELAGAPVLMVGLSAGSPEAAGLASRHPERAIGLLVRVPTAVTALTPGPASGVPAFVMQAQLDQIDRNAAVRSTFSANRSQGALWALGVELAVAHEDVSSLGNGTMAGWLASVLEVRLPASSGAPLVALAESSGWLGNQATLDIAGWADYPGDRTSASWLLSAPEAASWKRLGSPPSGGE